MNCLGAYRSRARIDARRGKSWYAVFAARIKISAVNAWTTKNPMEEFPKTAIATCATTERSSLATTPPTCVVSHEIPRNIVIAIIPITARVVAAFRACGRRKAGTPLEIASTPVSAVAPRENA